MMQLKLYMQEKSFLIQYNENGPQTDMRHNSGFI